MRLDLAMLTEPSGNLLDLEIVERKGLGHPDTICDHLTEELSLALSRHYLAQFGRVLHYNVDKALLWGGRSQPAFGGGAILEPMEVFLAGRATTAFGAARLPLAELAEDVVQRWFGNNLPLIDLHRHVRTHCLVRPGSSDLTDVFERRTTGTVLLANDTSCGIGYAPLSRLESIVYAVEQELGAIALRAHPEIGRDIKVMGVRRGRDVMLTVACAFVGRFLATIADYAAAKAFVADTAREVAAAHGADATVAVNVGDDLAAGSVYLTVVGTSAEGGDDGEAGRGNRVNGLITPFRPMTMESAAGKNAVTHVGKLYNLAAGLIAERIVEELPAIDEAQCFLVSGIGRPVSDPQTIGIRLRSGRQSSPAAHEMAIAAIVEEELARLAAAAEALAAGTLAIGRWPLRSRESRIAESSGDPPDRNHERGAS
ncbi:methionine adenosyltransferase [Chelatococcus sp. SYSU_G07232]|uniref:Methionine adenosyltransferase n=1 Tax=Chelatococcus albus TaxID=3047466 RepID=A0ABT7AE20_9HYPH|nr:methionine adenosyltransferase [Chelatococcus sp. SYSU_G07232]MDJ1157638.1 methionine adenosyltransferase [Chelatococcus sp. SYSU_G07232]